MATGLDHDNHRSLQRIATAMEGIVKELARTAERLEAIAGRSELPAEDVQDFAARIRAMTLDPALNFAGRLAAINEVTEKVLRGRDG